jgi:phage terminase small subunit
VAIKPRGLKTPGGRLWDAVTSEYKLAVDDLAVLEEACRTRDLIADLRAKVAENGLIVPSSQGERVNPAIVEGRQQAMLLAKLLGVLGLPDDIDDGED